MISSGSRSDPVETLSKGSMNYCMRQVLFTLLVFACGFANLQAANIHFAGIPSTDQIVIFDGRVEPGDEYKFAKATAGLTNVTVSLRSQGGDVATALFIGRVIHDRGLKTIVPSHAMCASACGFIWLAGKERTLTTTSQVGFHAAYIILDKKILVSPEGNALAGAYLRDIGLSDRAIIFLTQTQPTSMRWLTEADAKAIGVTYLVKVDPKGEPQEFMTVNPARKALLSLMLNPKRWPGKGGAWSKIGKGVEIPVQAYTQIHGRGLDSCKLLCSDDPMCKAVNFYQDGTCSLLDDLVFGQINDNVTSWGKTP